MYITITDDTNKYYRTWSSGLTKIEGCTCIQLDFKPDETDNEKINFYKLIETVKTKKEVRPVYDENDMPKFEEITDIDGNVSYGTQLTETIEVPCIEYSWKFDEDGYNDYINSKSSISPVPSIEDRLSATESAISALMELSLIM